MNQMHNDLPGAKCLLPLFEALGYFFYKWQGHAMNRNQQMVFGVNGYLGTKVLHRMGIGRGILLIGS